MMPKTARNASVFIYLFVGFLAAAISVRDTSIKNGE